MAGYRGGESQGIAGVTLQADQPCQDFSEGRSQQQTRARNWQGNYRFHMVIGLIYFCFKLLSCEA